MGHFKNKIQTVKRRYGKRNEISKAWINKKAKSGFHRGMQRYRCLVNLGIVLDFGGLGGSM